MISDEAAFFDADTEPGGLFIPVAAKLFARTGEWPWWFLRGVRAASDEVPSEYVRLALRYRRQLEHELGVTLPIVRATPAVAKRPTAQQLAIEGIGAAASKTTSAQRGAA